MKKQPAYLINTHHYSFRPGIPAKILGVEFVKTKFDNALCYRIKYRDGKYDYVAVSDVYHYKIVMYAETIKKRKK